MKTIGVIGGMGPMATLDLFSKMIRLVDGTCDQDFPHIVIDNNSKIPDRTAFLLGRGKDPTPALMKSAEKLVAFGAEVLAMPCNTAHAFYHDIKGHLDATIGRDKVVFLNMIEETVKVVSQKNVSEVMLLATDGTLRSGLYQKAFAKVGIKTRTPNDEDQRKIMKLIYDYKAGAREFDLMFIESAMTSYDMADFAIVLGCTELPLVFEIAGLIDRVISPTDILARRAIELIGE